MSSLFSNTESKRITKWLATVFVLTVLVVALMVALGLRNQTLPTADSDEKIPKMVEETERQVSAASAE